MEKTPIHFAFFGTSEFSVTVLDELSKVGLVPSVIITTEDKPAGRKMLITPPPTKVWAEAHGIPVFQPTSLREEKNPGITDAIRTLSPQPFDLFVVVSYGKIIPQTILDIPQHGTLNVHPSLLPKLRGPSPIESAILNENETGVTIMLLDAEMDHGPIVAQEKTTTPEWPPYFSDLEHTLAIQGGHMLAETMLAWVTGTITPTDQNHTQATVCKKISKEDALIDLADNPEQNLRKIRAYNIWPRAYMLVEKDGRSIRVIITRAHMADGVLVLEKVIPEGKSEMNFSDFQRGYSL